METNSAKIQPNSAMRFYCNFCDYKTNKKCNYDTHLISLRHSQKASQETLGNQIQPKISQIQLFCEKCNKQFYNRSGLWKHKNKSCCSDDNNMTTDKDIIMMLIKEHSEIKTLIMEVLKNGTNNQINNTTNTNSHNKAFNLQFFLNETCKNAMNIMDFADSIQLQLSDLEKVGELGYVEGISNIIVKSLKDLDVTQRPVHCTDKKRETMYIKDENTWEKDEEQKKMHKLVRKVADKNARMLPKFKEAHPDCTKSASRFSDQYNKIIMEAMGGKGDNDFEKEEKIIKRVSKEVIVDKEA